MPTPDLMVCRGFGPAGTLETNSHKYLLTSGTIVLSLLGHGQGWVS